MCHIRHTPTGAGDGGRLSTGSGNRGSSSGLGDRGELERIGGADRGIGGAAHHNRSYRNMFRPLCGHIVPPSSSPRSVIRSSQSGLPVGRSVGRGLEPSAGGGAWTGSRGGAVPFGNARDGSKVPPIYPRPTRDPLAVLCRVFGGELVWLHAVGRGGWSGFGSYGRGVVACELWCRGIV